MTVINEEMHLEKDWYKEADKQTLDTLEDFIKHLMNDYYHDYGTVCHAIAASAIAAGHAACNEPQGGITGFQASFVMWDFIKEWMYSQNKCGMKLTNYDDMLYPQYEYKFQKTITPGAWEKIQEEAKKNLENNDYACLEVRAHWKSIVDGKVPFGYIVKESD